MSGAPARRCGRSGRAERFQARPFALPGVRDETDRKGPRAVRTVRTATQAASDPSLYNERKKRGRMTRHTRRGVARLFRCACTPRPGVRRRGDAGGDGVVASWGHCCRSATAPLGRQRRVDTCPTSLQLHCTGLTTARSNARSRRKRRGDAQPTLGSMVGGITVAIVVVTSVGARRPGTGLDA